MGKHRHWAVTHQYGMLTFGLMLLMAISNS
jgi:hypothetical protein